jgi:hypothetical protein
MAETASKFQEISLSGTERNCKRRKKPSFNTTLATKAAENASEGFKMW